MKNEYFKITDDGKLKTSELLAKCRDKFEVWSWSNDEDLDKDFPKPKKTTTRYFLKNIEADRDLASKSAQDLEKEGIEGITLRERILMELSYFKETGKHLDIDNWTLCSGSRGSVGEVPDARWYGGKFFVYWYDPSHRYPYLRSRRAFETVPSNLEPSTLPEILVINNVTYKRQ